jgi:hypothetical protein
LTKGTAALCKMPHAERLAGIVPIEGRIVAPTEASVPVAKEDHNVIRICNSRLS